MAASDWQLSRPKRRVCSRKYEAAMLLRLILNTQTFAIEIPSNWVAFRVKLICNEALLRSQVPLPLQPIQEAA